jgi:hypothetical protein
MLFAEMAEDSDDGSSEDEPAARSPRFVDDTAVHSAARTPRVWHHFDAVAVVGATQSRPIRTFSQICRLKKSANIEDLEYEMRAGRYL